MTALRRSAAALAIGCAAVAIVVGERHRPRRQMGNQAGQNQAARTAGNVALGLMSMAVVAAVEGPVVRRLADRAARQRRGLAQRLPWPGWAQDAVAVLGMDYTVYLWHVWTHKVPALWRLHVIHHMDMDLDASTALRFHALDMLVSMPYRAAQVAVLGVSPRALRAWQGFFFVSVLFHHSNLRLPPRLERMLAAVFTTPSMHGFHHAARRDQTDSNWSSGLSLWDRLHGTLRLDGPAPGTPAGTPIGLPGYRDPSETRFWPSLRAPFKRQRDAWLEVGK